jgi:hypothetical protein
MPTNVLLVRRLFELMTDKKYRITHMFHMVSVLQITSSWFNMLRSARTLNHLIDFRQVPKLDQFVTVQCSMMINNHVSSITHHQVSSIFQGQKL